MCFSKTMITLSVYKMDHLNYSRQLNESLTDYSKTVLLMFLIKNDTDILTECCFLKIDVNRLCIDFEKILIEQNEDNLDYVKYGEETILKKILDIQMERLFATIFEDVSHDRSKFLIRLLTNPDISKQSKFTDHET